MLSIIRVDNTNFLSYILLPSNLIVMSRAGSRNKKKGGLKNAPTTTAKPQPNHTLGENNGRMIIVNKKWVIE